LFLDCVKEPVAKVDLTQFRYTTQTSVAWPAFFIFQSNEIFSWKETRALVVFVEKFTYPYVKLGICRW